MRTKTRKGRQTLQNAPGRVAASKEGQDTRPPRKPFGKFPLQALSEMFGVGSALLRRAMLAAGVEVKAGVRYTVREAYDALSGSGLMRAAKAREAAARATILELKAAGIQGETFRRAEAEAFIVGQLQPIRERLDALPATMAIETNPGDPGHARAALQRWVDGLVKEMSQRSASTTKK